MDATLEHPTHLKSDIQTGDERARQREAMLERSDGSSSIAVNWFAYPPCQEGKERSIQFISNAYANQCSPFGDDKSQPLV